MESTCYSGAVMAQWWQRPPASHQCGLGSIPARCHKWAEFVAVSHLALRVFSPGTPLFLPPQKPTFLSPNSTRTGDPRESS